MPLLQGRRRFRPRGETVLAVKLLANGAAHNTFTLPPFGLSDSLDWIYFAVVWLF